MDNNRIFFKDLGNRLMVEFEEILNIYEQLLDASKADYRTFGEESRTAGEIKYNLLRKINERTAPLKQDFSFFAEQMYFPTGKMEWELPFDEFYESVDIEADTMVMDQYFLKAAEDIYKDIREQSGNVKEIFFGNFAKYFYPCPCCERFLFTQNGDYEICGVCKWENDKVQNQDPRFEGGANKENLIDYRIRYRSGKNRL